MKSVIKKIAMLSMLSCFMGSASLLMSIQKPTINEEQKALLQSQINSLSEQFAALAQDAQLSDALKTEYKNLTTAITDFLASLKTGDDRDINKLFSLGDGLKKFKNDLKADSQYKQYEKSNEAIVSNLKNLVDNIVNEVKFIRLPLMKEPVKEVSKPVQVKVINVPKDHFIAAGVLYHNDGKTNYSMQPNTNGIYTFYSDHYYAAAANDRGSFVSQRKGSEFSPNNIWDVTANTIS